MSLPMWSLGCWNSGVGGAWPSELVRSKLWDSDADGSKVLLGPSPATCPYSNSLLHKFSFTHVRDPNKKVNQQ